MGMESVVNRLPFVEHLGIEVTAAADGHATATLELEPEHSSNPEGLVAHGGVTFSLADTVGGAAVMSASESVSPTIDMRIDYLAPVTADLRAEAEVLRLGGAVAVADVEVYDADDHHVATARGVYKVGGQGEGTPWTDREHESLDPMSLDDVESGATAGSTADDAEDRA